MPPFSYILRRRYQRRADPDFLKDFVKIFKRVPANFGAQLYNEANCFSFIDTVFNLVLLGRLLGAIRIVPVLSSRYPITPR